MDGRWHGPLPDIADWNGAEASRKSGIIFAMKQSAKRWNQRSEPKRTYSIAVGSAISVKRGEEVVTYVGVML